MVLPLILYINHNLIIQQISAKMNYQHKIIQRQIKLCYSIDLNDADEHDIKFYKQMVRIQEHLALKLGNYEIIQEMYFPDGVWNLIKSFAFNRIDYLTKLRKRLIPITWELKDLYRFGDSRTTYYHERKLYYLYICQQVENIDTEIRNIS